jgi:hypothetical protein
MTGRMIICSPHPEAHLFEEIAYQEFRPAVEEAKGSFIVTRSGVVWPSIHWSHKTVYRSPAARGSLLVITVASLLRRGSEHACLGERVGIIHSVWTGGYYHWLTESLPRALALQNAYPSAIPILPDKKYINYVDSLVALGFKEIAFFPDGKNLRVTNPIITSCPAEFATTAPELLLELSRKIKAHYGVASESPSLIVYASRSKARGRFVLNETELLRSISHLSPQVVHFEDLSFGEQVALLSKTKILISIHGAGLTNMMFMPRNGLVIELLPRRNGLFDYHKERNSFRHDACYVRLAQAFGHRHVPVICPQDAPFWKSTHWSNILAPTRKLLEILGDELGRGAQRRCASQ